MVNQSSSSLGPDLWQVKVIVGWYSHDISFGWFKDTKCLNKYLFNDDILEKNFENIYALDNKRLQSIYPCD